ncbi:MAG: tubulin-like doman-containing protein [Candidatus Eremiobacterota bacterium]
MSRIFPSLIIGIGGTGKSAVYDIRSRIISKFGSLDTLKVINFLVLDTDIGLSDINENEGLFKKATKLNAIEHIHLQVQKNRLDEIKNGLNRCFPHYSDWLNLEALITGEGLNTIRQRSRLAFYEHYKDIAERINTQAINSVSDEAVKATINVGYDVYPHVLDVYVIGSLIGATGAGVFIDLGYLIEEILIKTSRLGDIAVEHTGIFVLPSGKITLGACVDTRASSYAALVELNHYSDPDTIFNIITSEHKKITSVNPPYNLTYLVSSQNDLLELNRRTLVNMIGQKVFLEITSSFFTSIRSSRDCIKHCLVKPDLKRCNQNYCTFGISTLEVPVHAVINSCGAMFLRDVFTELKEGKYVGQTQKLAVDKNFVKQKLASHNMGEHEIKKYLAEINGRNLTAIINNHIDQVDTIPVSELIKVLGNMEQEMEESFLEKKAEGSFEGKFVKEVRENHSNFLTSSDGFLSELISELCNNPEFRLVYTERFFDLIKSYYRELHERHLRENEGLKQNIEKGKKAFEMCKFGAKELLDDSLLLFWIPIVTKDFLNRVYKNIARRYLGLKSQYLINCYFIKVMEEVNRTISKIESKLNSFSNYVDNLIKNYDRLIEIAKKSFVAINGDLIYPMENKTSTLNDFIDETYKKAIGTDADKRKSINAFYTANIVPIIQKNENTKPDIFLLQKDEIEKEDMKDGLYVKAKEIISVRGKPEEIDVVKMFYNQYMDKADSEFIHLHAQSNPFLIIDKNADHYQNETTKSLHKIGFYSATNPQEDHHRKFKSLVGDRIENIKVTESLGNVDERYQVIFYQEYSAFPLRLWTALDSLKVKYEYYVKNLNLPLHNEKKGFQFIPIDKATKEEVDELIKIFLIANVPGINVFNVSDTRKGKEYGLDYFEGTFKRTIQLKGEVKEIPPQITGKKRDIQAIKDEICSIKEALGDEKFAGYIINYFNEDLREIYRTEEEKPLLTKYSSLIEKYLEEEGLKDISKDLTREFLEELRRTTSGETHDSSEKVCPKCKAVNSPDTLFCSKCGISIDVKEENPAEEITCPDCGFLQDPETVFCSNCGYDFKKKEEPKDKNCPQCTSIQKLDTVFCSKCGYNFAVEKGKPVINNNESSNKSEDIFKLPEPHHERLMKFNTAPSFVGLEKFKKKHSE